MRSFVRPLRKVLASTSVRLAVSAALITGVLVRVGPGPIADALRDARVPLVIAAVGALLAAFLVAAERWRVFLDAAGLSVDRAEAVRITFIGALTTNVLPGGAGGDVARAWLVSPGRRAEGLATVVVDRVTLFGCSVLLGWLAFPFAEAPGKLAAALAATTAVGAALAIAASGAVDVSRRLGRRAPRLGAVLGPFGTSLRECVVRPRVWLLTTVLGVVYQSCVVLEVWLLCGALGLGLSYALVATVTPPVLVLSALPFSIGGIGIREISYVTLLAPVGVAASGATSLGLLAGLSYLAASLPGVAWLATRGRRRRAELPSVTAAGVAEITSGHP
jgi:uncharacterized protein (TIRG00374 family)